MRFASFTSQKPEAREGAKSRRGQGLVWLALGRCDGTDGLSSPPAPNTGQTKPQQPDDGLFLVLAHPSSLFYDIFHAVSLINSIGP